MVAKELRYLGYIALVPIAWIGAVYAAAWFGHSAGLPNSVGFSIALALCGAASLGIVVLYLRGEAKEQYRPARVAPIVAQIVALLIFSYLVVDEMIGHVRTHVWARDPVLTLFIFAFICATNYSTVRDWWLRRTGRPAYVSEFRNRRLTQYEAALQLPTQAEQRAALRPFVYKGYLRFALILLPVTAIPAFADRFGVGLVLVAAFVVSTGTFLILHKVYDL